MSYLVFDLNKKKYLASATKTLKPGYLHTYDYYVDWTPRLREAKEFGLKEARKWAERTYTSVIKPTTDGYEVITTFTKAG